ncbi:MAG TPA: hypothetical protein VHY59_07215 [Chthoniobacterales bacterium]|jgi:hypothetical protein|nr:hypothetical protein [Chthoniobacterales bacterium]
MDGTVTRQRLHNQLAEIDVLTREELDESLHKGFDAILRERYRGLEIQRIPFVPITATAATQNLFTTNDATPWGPEQGDLWMLRRVIVKSNVLTDTAKYVVFRGSTPSDVANAYGTRFLLDAGIGGATPGVNVNVAIYFSTKSVFLQPGEQVYAQVLAGTVNNQYYLEGEAIRVPAEQKGKIL